MATPNSLGFTQSKKREIKGREGREALPMVKVNREGQGTLCKERGALSTADKRSRMMRTKKSKGHSNSFSEELREVKSGAEAGAEDKAPEDIVQALTSLGTEDY